MKWRGLVAGLGLGLTIAGSSSTSTSSASSASEKPSKVVTLPLAPLVPGDKVGHYQLEWRLDSLGIEKLFARDHSYFGIAPPDDYYSLSPGLLPNLNGERMQENKDREDEGEEESHHSSEHEITPLEDVPLDPTDSSIKNGDYYLNRKIFFGGHGEIWLAKKILENGHLEVNSSYVLKRMHLKDRPEILRCALREIYFGELFQHSIVEANYRVTRFITHFQLNDDHWLVFHDEGVSLQSLLYALTVDRGGTLPSFEPSQIWKRMRTTMRGDESMKSILYQIFLGEYLTASP
jgi:hypothetical protein